ncbi:hypothetical protein Q1695_008497 [Nippostrongylus brasiliensis]|nr:hypothetical protein Q1695_008497 [Nippostrongylus brasiliensis]
MLMWCDVDISPLIRTGLKNENMHMLLLLYVVTSPTIALKHTTGSGWVKHITSGDCFLYIATKATYTEAVEHCKTLNSSLTIICTAEENEFVSLMGRIAIDDWTEAGDVWIGAERVDGKFKWTSEDSSCTYTNFEPGEPNFYRQKEFCWHIYSGDHWRYNKWNDYFCDRKKHFVCRKKGCNVPV